MTLNARSVGLGLLMAFLAYLSWGLLSPLGKILLADFPPMTLNAVRMTLATAILLPLVGIKNIRDGLDYLRTPAIFGTVLLGGGLGFTAFMLAVQRLDATYATFGFYTAPLWTAILANIRLGEEVGRTFFPAFLLLAAGGWFALGGTTELPGNIDPLGMAWAVGSGVIWAFYSVGLRKHAQNLRLRPLMVATFVISTLYFIVIAVLTEGVPTLTGHSAATWGWALLYAAVPTVLALWLFNAAAKRAPASLLNIFISMELASAAVFSYWLLGDRFTDMQIIGLGLSIFAVSWYLWTRRLIYRPDGMEAPYHE